MCNRMFYRNNGNRDGFANRGYLGPNRSPVSIVPKLSLDVQ